MKALKVLALSAAVALASGYVSAATVADSSANAGAISGSQAGASAVAGTSQSGVYIDQSSQGNNYSSPKQPVWGAASLMLSGCQDGTSAQGQSAGVASAFESATCTKLRMAETYQKLAIYYEAKGDRKQAAMYNRLLGEAVAQAGDASDVQHVPKIIGGTASSVIPLGALLWLFTLI